MKVLVTLLTTFLFISIINCSSNKGNFPKLPGCEKMKDFADITLQKCCENIPYLTNKSSYKECFEFCKSKDEEVPKHCCLSDCVLKYVNVLNETGFFDFEAAKTLLIDKVSDDEKWVEIIKSSIETCATEAPQILEQWKKKSAPKCETAINMVSKHCITRQLFFNCPEKTDTKECKSLEAFGKGCPLFPVPRMHHMKGDGAKKNADSNAKEEE